MVDKSGKTIIEVFRSQAEVCRAMHAPFTASVIDAAADVVDATSRTGRRILGLDRDHSGYGEATGLRLAGGLHALARSGRVPRLSAFYRDESGDAHAAVRAAIAAEDAWLERWLDLPPQTNETARSAAVMAGLLVAVDRFGLPFELLELGSSAGLNLNLAHYRFDLGGVAAGDPASPLVLAPKWHGPPPPAADVRILSARGIDMSPIAIADPENRERLIAYIWPEQTERVMRLETAIAIAEANPPRLERGDAADWIEARLTEPRTPGVARIVFHTITFQYFPDSTKARVEHAIKAAGEAADAETPLGWLQLEANADRDICELRLTLWPDGTELHLADAHPHCAWISWRG